MLETTLDPVFAERGLSVRLGLLAATLASGGDDALRAGLLEAARSAAARASDAAAGTPAIAAARRALKACGKDPSRYRPASEALLRRVLKGEPPPQVNAAVDVTNLVALQTGIACGVYARAALAPPLRLRLGTTADRYEGIGRGSLNVANLPVLADAAGAFGSPVSDSVRTAVDEGTAALLFVAYGFDVAVDDALALAGHAFERYAGAHDLTAWQVAAAA